MPEAEEADSVQELLHERVDSFRSAKPLAASAGGGRRRGTVMLAKGASLSSLESAFGSADSVAGKSHTLQRLLTAQVSRVHEITRDCARLRRGEVAAAPSPERRGERRGERSRE